jgi:hypothetical protein
VAQALVKDRHSLRLLDWPALVALAQAAAGSPPMCTASTSAVGRAAALV